MAGALGSIIVAGSMKSLTLSLQTAQVARSALTELELKQVVAKTLRSGECGGNLTPTTKLKAGTNPTTDPLKGVGVVDKMSFEGQDLIEKGKDFKGDLRIVKLALKGNANQDPKGTTVERVFVVYYKKNNLGVFSTVGGEDCTETNQAGCYHHQCRIQYGLSPDDGDNTVTTCKLLDCSGDLVVRSSGCYGNHYFKGHDPWTGEPICSPLPFIKLPECSDGKKLVGTSYWPTSFNPSAGEGDRSGDISCQEFRNPQHGALLSYGNDLDFLSRDRLGGIIENGTAIPLEMNSVHTMFKSHCLHKPPLPSSPFWWNPITNLIHNSPGETSIGSTLYGLRLAYLKCSRKQVTLVTGTSTMQPNYPCPESGGFFWNSRLCTCDRIPTKPAPPPPTCTFQETDLYTHQGVAIFQKAEGVLAGTHKHNVFCASLFTRSFVINYNPADYKNPKYVSGWVMPSGGIESTDPDYQAYKTYAGSGDYFHSGQYTQLKQKEHFCPAFPSTNNYKSSYCRDKVHPILPCPAGSFFHLHECACKPL